MIPTTAVDLVYAFAIPPVCRLLAVFINCGFPTTAPPPRASPHSLGRHPERMRGAPYSISPNYFLYHFAMNHSAASRTRPRYRLLPLLFPLHAMVSTLRFQLQAPTTAVNVPVDPPPRRWLLRGNIIKPLLLFYVRLILRESV